MGGVRRPDRDPAAQPRTGRREVTLLQRAEGDLFAIWFGASDVDRAVLEPALDLIGAMVKREARE